MSRRRRSIIARCRIRMSFGRFAGNMAWRLMNDTCGIEAWFVAPRWGLFPFCPADPRLALVPRLPWAGLCQAVGLKCRSRTAWASRDRPPERHRPACEPLRWQTSVPTHPRAGSTLRRGPKARQQASPGQSEPASDALGQQPAISSSPNGAGQQVINPFLVSFES